MADYALAPPLPSLAGGTTAQAGGVEGYDLERLADELEGIVRGDVGVGVDVDVVDVVIVEGRYLLCSRRLVEVAGVKVCAIIIISLNSIHLKMGGEGG